MLLSVMMIVLALPATTFAADEAEGKVLNAYLANDNFGSRITVDMADVTFKESIALKLYDGNDVLLTTTTLNTNLDVGPGIYSDLTGMIALEEKAKDGYWVSTQWQPHDSVVPKYVKLFVDGKEMDSEEIKTNQTILGGVSITAEDWAKQPGTAGVKIDHAWLNVDDSRITIDMGNILFNDSLVLQLLSKGTVITESALNTVLLKPGMYGELTGAIMLDGSDEYWSQAPWKPNDKIIPDEVRVVVDGLVAGTHEIYNASVEHGEAILTAEEWYQLSVTECVFEQWGFDSNDHWKSCQCDKTTEKEPHNFGEWTIVESATTDSPGKKVRTCGDCGYEAFEVIDAHAHQVELVGKVDATCSAEGYTGDNVCMVCGEVIEEGKVIDKLDHNFKDGQCTVCGEEDPDYKPVDKPTDDPADKPTDDPADKPTDDPTDKPTDDPTDDPADKPNDEPNDKPADKPNDKPADKPDTPQTGDNSNVALLIALLSAAGISLCGARAYNRKK